LAAKDYTDDEFIGQLIDVGKDMKNLYERKRASEEWTRPNRVVRMVR
jgi:hypothetical protein